MIIVGIMNGLAGMGYAAAGGAGELAKEAAAQAAANTDTSKMNAEQKAQVEKAQADIKKATGDANTGGMAIFGIFLIVMLALQIAGAVTLFMQKAAKFIMVVAVLGLVAELGGMAFGVPFGITNILGIVASILAFLAARSIAAGPAAA